MIITNNGRTNPRVTIKTNIIVELKFRLIKSKVHVVCDPSNTY